MSKRAKKLFSQILPGRKFDEIDYKIEDLLNNFNEILAEHGIDRKMPSPLAWSNYFRLPEEQKPRVFDSLSLYVNFLVEGQKDGIDFFDSRQIMQWAKFRMKVIPVKGFVENLQKDDLLEIFDENDIQIFRNLQFFEVTNYTLLDLLTNSWEVLYQRDHLINKMLLNLVGSVKCGKIQELYQFTIDEHKLTEIMATPPVTHMVKLKFLSPVSSAKDGKYKGFIVSSTARLAAN